MFGLNNYAEGPCVRNTSVEHSQAAKNLEMAQSLREEFNFWVLGKKQTKENGVFSGKDWVYSTTLILEAEIKF